MTVAANRRAAVGHDLPPAQRLLRAAEELFGESSYRQATVAGICARAGIATGSFYAHFSSKAEIFAAVVRQINADLRMAMRTAVEQAGADQRDRERAAFRAFFDMLSQRPWMDRVVRESEFVDPGLFREYYEHLARLLPRGAPGPACPRGGRQVRPGGDRLHLHRDRQLHRHALGRLDRGRPRPRGRPR